MWRRAAGWWLVLSVPGCIPHLVIYNGRGMMEPVFVCMVSLTLGLWWLLHGKALQPETRSPSARWKNVDYKFLLTVLAVGYVLLVGLFVFVQPPPATVLERHPWGVFLWGALAADLLLVFPFFAVAWVHVRRKGIPTAVWQMTAALGGGAMALTRVMLGGVLLCMAGMVIMPDVFPALGDNRHEQFAASRFVILRDGFLPDVSYRIEHVIPRLNLHPDEVCVLLAPFALFLAAAARAVYEVRRMWAPQFDWRELPPWPFD